MMGIEFNDTSWLGFERTINPFFFLVQMWHWWWSDKTLILLSWVFGGIWDLIVWWYNVPAVDKIMPTFYLIVALLFSVNGFILLAEGIMILMLLYIANF